jgi:hypothetical protein
MSFDTFFKTATNHKLTTMQRQMLFILNSDHKCEYIVKNHRQIGVSTLLCAYALYCTSAKGVIPDHSVIALYAPIYNQIVTLHKLCLTMLERIKSHCPNKISQYTDAPASIKFDDQDARILFLSSPKHIDAMRGLKGPQTVLFDIYPMDVKEIGNNSHHYSVVEKTVFVIDTKHE